MIPDGAKNENLCYDNKNGVGVGSTSPSSNHYSQEGTEMATNDRTTTFVYFITVDSHYVKIGVTGDLVTRLRRLQTAHHQEVQLLYTIECETRERALELEAALHDFYHAAHVRNEWFKISSFDLFHDIRLMVSLLSNGVAVRNHFNPNFIFRREVTYVDVRDLARELTPRLSVSPPMNEDEPVQDDPR